MTCERLARALVCFVLVSAACADFSRGGLSSPAVDAAGHGDGGDASTAEGGGSLSFATAVYPLLVPACSKCHASGQEAGDAQLLFAGSPATDYDAVLRFVDTSAPAGSRLLSKMSGNGHQGGAVYAAGSPEYQTVLHWIEQGAQP